MKSLLFVLFLLCCAAPAAAADVTVTTTVTTAHEDACHMARTGVLRHRGRCNCREGIGFSSVSAEDALARCCYNNGRYRIKEKAVVRGARGWFACIRYE